MSPLPVCRQCGKKSDNPICMRCERRDQAMRDAAPELYEALLELASMLGALPMTSDQIVALMPFQKAAKTALCKARGEQ